MRAIRVAGVLAACGLLLGAGRARAEGYWTVREHPLLPADSFRPGPELTDPGFAPWPEWDFPAEHLAEGSLYTDPFLGPELFPELSAGTTGVAVTTSNGGPTQYTQLINLNMYWVQFRLPAFSAVDGRTTNSGQADADLLLPWRIDAHQRAAVLVGTELSTLPSTTLMHGLRAQAMYGFGVDPFDLQVRAGYGVHSAALDQTVLSQNALLFGGHAGLSFADWIRLVVEADGAHTGDHVTLLRVAPGLRFYPEHTQTLQLGFAAVLTLDATPGVDLGLRSAGGLADLSYNFL